MINATYQDETDGHVVTLTIGEANDWGKTRRYFELYQSDRRTRVGKFYEVYKGRSSDPKNDFYAHDRMFSFQLAYEKNPSPNYNLVKALQELAIQIVNPTF